MSVMPQLTSPGVYIQEVPSGVRTIVGVPTSITAFIGRALRGPVNAPTRIESFADFERIFGGLWVDSTMSYAVRHYYLNLGTDAIIVRIQRNAAKATLTLQEGAGTFVLEAANEGSWGNHLRARVDYKTRPLRPDEAPSSLFNLSVKDEQTGVVESFLNVSIEPKHARFVTKVLEQDSDLVRVSAASTPPAARPDAHPDPAQAGADPLETTGSFKASDNNGTDGDPLTYTEYEGVEANKTGIYALEKADIFNMLCIPPFARDTDVADTTLTETITYCKKRRAMMIIDAPSTWTKVKDAVDGMNALTIARDKNAAMFFPRVKMPDGLLENRLEEFAPSGIVAGIIARTDGQRGVWKAPAGLEAILMGVPELTVKLTDGEHGQLNPQGLNCLRQFPVVGSVIWGSRTLAGADMLADEYKYLPVRRLALHIEESLYRGTQWVVFEPNDEPLWAQIRLNVGAFMHGFFRQGAFQGKTPQEAYFVKCDKDTTTQDDINHGIVNILVGFAPLKPAEFVVIKISQLAGQIQA